MKKYMKKILIALLLGSLLALALVTIALADNGPHGNFSATTGACAGCHRAHSAQYGSNNLLIADPEALCLSCHGSGATGAYTNVEDGVYGSSGTEGTSGASLFGGGFDKALMATAWSGKVTFDAAYNGSSKTTTSKHDVGSPGSTVWGSGAINTTNDKMTLECTSCHDPHGNAGWDTSTTPDTRVASYRLLRWQPQGSNGFSAPGSSVNWSGGAFPSNDASTPVSGWLVPDKFATNGKEWYTIGTTGSFAVGDYNAGNANNVYNIKNPLASEATTYIPAATNVPFFCAQCHDRYFNNSKLRNNTDDSVYCGAPAAKTVNGVVLTVYPPTVTGQHPVDPTRCEPVYTGASITAWGDNGSSGDTTYAYRHSSGDIRLSMDSTVAAGSGSTVSRACVACHVAHGTTAAADGAGSPNEALNTKYAATGSLAGGSVLLRMDNRSVCLRCHASTVNFTVGP